MVQELHEDEDFSINENALFSSGEMVLMQTAMADISNPNSRQMQNETAEDTPDYDMLIMTHSTNTVKGTSLLLPDRSLATKPNLKYFWRLDSLGITDSPVDSDKERTLKIFNKTLKFEDERYRVTWPWEEDKNMSSRNP